MINELTDITLDNADIQSSSATNIRITGGSIDSVNMFGNMLSKTHIIGDITIGSYTIDAERFGDIIKHLHMELFPEDHI